MAKRRDITKAGSPETSGFGRGEMAKKLAKIYELEQTEEISGGLKSPEISPLCGTWWHVLHIPTMKSAKTGSEGQGEQDNAPDEQPKEQAAVKEEVIEKIDFSKVEIEPLFEDLVDFETFSKSDFRAVKVKDCVAVPKSKKLLQFTLDDGSGKDRTILSGIHAYYEPEQLIGKTCIAITNLPPRAMMGIESCGMLISAVHKEEGEEKLHLLMVDPHIPAGAKMY